MDARCLIGLKWGHDEDNLHTRTAWESPFYSCRLSAVNFLRCLTMVFMFVCAHSVSWVMSGTSEQPIAFGTALVLIIIVLIINLLAGGLRKYFEKRLKLK